MSRLLLGVDGGGTKTIARVCIAHEETHQLCVLGSGLAAGSNPYSVGWESATHAIAMAARSAWRDADVEDLPEVGVLSIAGCASPAARERLASEIADFVIANQIHVVPDTAPLVSDAPTGVPIVGVIAGTGSSVVGKDAKGCLLQIGGWGYLIDDAGSGFAVGQAALKRLCAADDEQQSLDAHLERSVYDLLEIDSIADLKSRVYTSKDQRSAIAALARVTIDAAQQGSDVADEICRSQAEQLARLAATCARRVGAYDSDAECSMAGGLLVGSPYYRGLFVESLRAAWPQAVPQMAPDAACGCCQIASREPVASK